MLLVELSKRLGQKGVRAMEGKYSFLLVNRIDHIKDMPISSLKGTGVIKGTAYFDFKDTGPKIQIISCR